MDMNTELAKFQEWYPSRKFVIKNDRILEQRTCPDCGTDWLASDLGEGLFGSKESCRDCKAAYHAQYESGAAERAADNRRKIETNAARERWCD